LVFWMQATDPPRSNVPFELDFPAYVPGLESNLMRPISEGCRYDAMHGRHTGKTLNVAYVDGHLKRVRAEELAVRLRDGAYTNRSPLWAPR